MNPRELGFLLLTSSLGDPGRKPLTTAQFRELTARVRNMRKPEEDRNIIAEDLILLGYDRDTATRILSLLSQKALASRYVQRGAEKGCFPLVRLNDNYPAVLRTKLGMDAPGTLWIKGDITLLFEKAVSLVGSRDLREDNFSFAREAGRQAALQGYVLISGNARGADRAAQEACLENGGKVICVVADELCSQPDNVDILYISEDGYDLPFSAQRALQRNRIIHCLGQRVLVAQSNLGKGGTWSGTTKNLRNNWTPVCCYDDGSEANRELNRQGAFLIGFDDLSDFSKLPQPDKGFFD